MKRRDGSRTSQTRRDCIVEFTVDKSDKTYLTKEASVSQHVLISFLYHVDYVGSAGMRTEDLKLQHASPGQIQCIYLLQPAVTLIHTTKGSGKYGIPSALP
jgi:hypothetical protein